MIQRMMLSGVSTADRDAAGIAESRPMSRAPPKLGISARPLTLADAQLIGPLLLGPVWPNFYIGSSGFGVDCQDIDGDGNMDARLAAISHPVNADASTARSRERRAHQWDQRSHLHDRRQSWIEPGLVRH
jgi:hypothetical protein